MPVQRFLHASFKRIYRMMFPIAQRFHIHILPITPHLLDTPIPDTRTLSPRLWSVPSALCGIEMNEPDQLELLARFVSLFKSEYDAFPRHRTATPYQYCLGNGMFDSVDAEVLYSMVRYFKPRRIIEVGAGFSTYLSAQAVRKNGEEDAGYTCELVAIEPYPNKTLASGFPGLTKLIAARVQDVPLSEFQKLTENDILFIDSSHVLKIGSDVAFIYLELLPRLNRGVLVHIHDIFLPVDYPYDWVMKEYRFWNEQYLLQAFLSFNNAFAVVWAASYLRLRHPDKLEAAFSSYQRDTTWPASFWIRRVR